MSVDVVYYVACSLDGYIATTDGGVEWLAAFQGPGEDYGFAEFNKSVEALLMGSHTYEFALTQPAWPAPDTPSWVFTKRSLSIAHPSVTLTSDDPSAVVAELESRGLRRAWLMGGAALAGSFQSRRLISEYLISVMPVVLGEGIPLFTGTAHLHALELTGTKHYASGIVQLSYEPKSAS